MLNLAIDAAMMMMMMTSCVEVFCDVTGGVLAARHPRDDDDVSLMTSSATNVRRTCSYYEPMSSSSQFIYQQQYDDEQNDDMNAVKLAECVELQCVDDMFHDDISELPPPPDSLLQQDLDVPEQHPDVTQSSQSYTQPATNITTTTTTVLPPPPSSSPSSSSSKAAAAAGGRPIPVIPRRPRPVSFSVLTADDISGSGSASGSGKEPEIPKRPTPPVSRVKPMIRHNAIAAQQHIQLKTLSDNSTDVTAHASSRPVPVPARRHQASINTVDDIPSDLATLSVADVAKCVTLLGLGQQQADMMLKHGVDGKQLIKLSINQLTDEYQFTPLDASKLARFLRGWRPT